MSSETSSLLSLSGLKNDDVVSSVLGGVDSTIDGMVGETAFEEATLTEAFFGRMGTGSVGITSFCISGIPAVVNLEKGNYYEAGKGFSGLLVGTMFGEGGAVIGNTAAVAGAALFSSAIEGAELGGEIGTLAGPIGTFVGGTLGVLLGTAVGYWEWKAANPQGEAGKGGVYNAAEMKTIFSDPYYKAGAGDSNSGDYLKFGSVRLPVSAAVGEVLQGIQAYEPTDLAFSSSTTDDLTVFDDGSSLRIQSGPRYSSIAMYYHGGAISGRSINNYPSNAGESTYHWDVGTYTPGIGYWNMWMDRKEYSIDGVEVFQREDGAVESVNVGVTQMGSSLDYKKIDVDGSSKEVCEGYGVDGSYFRTSSVGSSDGSSTYMRFGFGTSGYEYRKLVKLSDGSVDDLCAGQMLNGNIGVSEYITRKDGSSETIHVSRGDGNVESDKEIYGGDGSYSRSSSSKMANGDESALTYIENADGSGEASSVYAHLDGSSQAFYSKHEKDGSVFSKNINTYANGDWHLGEGSLKVYADGSKEEIDLGQSSDGSGVYSYHKYGSDGATDYISQSVDVDKSSVTTEIIQSANGDLESVTLKIDSDGITKSYSDVKIFADGSELKNVFNKYVNYSVDVDTKIEVNGDSDVTTITSNDDGSLVSSEVVTKMDGSVSNYVLIKNADGSSSAQMILEDSNKEVLENDIKFFTSDGYCEVEKKINSNGSSERIYEQIDPAGTVYYYEDDVNSGSSFVMSVTKTSSDGGVVKTKTNSVVNGDGTTDCVTNTTQSNGDVTVRDTHTDTNGNSVDKLYYIYADGTSATTEDIYTKNSDGSTLQSHESLNSNGSKYFDAKNTWANGVSTETITSLDGSGNGYRKNIDVYLTGNIETTNYLMQNGVQVGVSSRDLSFVNGSNGDSFDFSFDGASNVVSASGRHYSGDPFPGIVLNENVGGGDLSGTADADIFIADNGNGVLSGGGGGDLYFFNTLAGNHVVDDEDGKGCIEISQGVDLYHLTVAKVGDDLQLGNGEGSLVVKNQFSMVSGQKGAKGKPSINAKNNINTVDGGQIRTYINSMDGSYGIWQGASDGSYINTSYYSDGSIEYRGDFDAIDGITKSCYFGENYSSESITTTSSSSTTYTDKDGSVYSINDVSGNDWVSYDDTNSVYSFNVSSGAGAVAIAATKKNASTLDILSIDAASDALVFSRNSNNLDIQFGGAGDKIDIKDWFSSDQSKISELVTNDGKYIDSSQVDLLVAAMAGFDPSPSSTSSGSGGITSEYFQTLTPNIGASWHNS